MAALCRLGHTHRVGREFTDRQACRAGAGRQGYGAVGPSAPVRLAPIVTPSAGRIGAGPPAGYGVVVLTDVQVEVPAPLKARIR